MIEGRPQPPLLIGVDRRVGEAAEKRIRFLRETQCRYAGGIEARIVLQRPMDAERARREAARSRRLDGCFLLPDQRRQPVNRCESGRRAVLQVLQDAVAIRFVPPD